MKIRRKVSNEELDAFWNHEISMTELVKDSIRDTDNWSSASHGIITIEVPEKTCLGYEDKDK